METINQVLKVLFQEVRSEDVITQILKVADTYHNFDSLVDQGIFARQLLHVNASETLDHAGIVYHVFRDEWSMPNMHDYNLMYCKYPELFNVLLHFSCNKILIENDRPICRYEELLSWHEITRDFGEDLFVTSYRAAYDLRRNLRSSSFDWNCYLANDAKELQEVFDKEMYDLHAHLYGSSLNFELNWMSLMNILGGHEAKFDKLDTSKICPSMAYRFNSNGRPLYVKVLCAAIIRLYLFLDTIAEDWTTAIQARLSIYEVLACQNLIEMLSYAKVAQEYIDILCFCKARKYVNPATQTKNIPDYAIMGEDKSLFSILGGERRLMYNVFRKIYLGEYRCDKKSALFYIYLLIKEELRKEMVQVNNSLGFENFSDYQLRKCMFIQDGSIYENLLAQLAVGSFMSDSHAKRYVEMRIAPGNTMKDNLRQIQQNDEYITGSSFAKNFRIGKDDFHYIYHFIKLKDHELCDTDYCTEFCLQPRHNQLRKEIERQAKAIYGLMCSGHEDSKRLVGIDAANSEICCRPEVFARTYRYLSQPFRYADCLQPQKLGKTYHVGEDFYDVVDGLRAIDEVLKFLGFRNGDRLGHALSLGVDVVNYYERHNYRINATRQVLLDNVAWLFIQSERLGCSTTVLAYLKELYSIYYHRIFPDALAMADVFTYYQSWLLRGDSPYCYQNGDIAMLPDYSAEIMDSWNKVAFNHHLDIDNARKNKEACRLYYMYHFNMTVRKNGAMSEVLKIKSEYRKALLTAIRDVQQHLLNQIEQLHIAIECNPSSNFKIGEFNRYDEHPIIKFNNHGLSSPHPHHAISVSINTDDAGIFSTSLEREYSLMALALEKHEDEEHPNTPREIMEWLERVRLMAKEQCFNK